MSFFRDAVEFVLMVIGSPLMYEHKELTAADVIIVLGTTIHPGGNPSRGMIFRARHASQLLRQGLAKEGKIILSGGGNPSEARMMSKLVSSFGINESSLILEEQSRVTKENALRSKAIMDQRGWKSAIIVTSPYHVKRAVRTFRLLGIEVYGSAAFPPTEYPLSTLFKVIAHEYSAWIKWMLTYLCEMCGRILRRPEG